MYNLLPHEHQRFSLTTAIAITGDFPRPTAFGSLKFHVPSEIQLKKNNMQLTTEHRF